MYPKRDTTSKDLVITIDSQKTIRKNPQNREPRQVGPAGTSSLLALINIYLEHGGGPRPAAEDLSCYKQCSRTFSTRVLITTKNNNFIKDSQLRASLGVKLTEDVANPDADFVFDPDDSFDCSCGMISCSEEENRANSGFFQDTSSITSDESDEPENAIRGASG